MKIDLLFSVWHTNDGYNHDFEKYRMENEEQLNNFFSSSDETLEVSVSNKVDDFFYNFKEWSDSIKFMLLDLKDPSSTIYKFFGFPHDDMEKVVLFERIFKGFILEKERSPFRVLGEEEDAQMDAMYGTKGYSFIFYVNPKYCNCMTLDVYDLDRDTILDNLLPRYYIELGAWDREYLRNDTEEMMNLHNNLLQTLRIGMH